jgi:hypothetical protein
MSQPMTVSLRIICLNAPPDHLADGQVIFGLQDKDRVLHQGQRHPDGTLIFQCEVRVKQIDSAPTPRFVGPFVHGTGDDRFLYLSLRQAAGDEWARRMKVKLKAITWDQIAGATSGGDAVMEVSVDGTRSGTVPLLEDGWVVRTRG